jgi:hypothetical protein
MAEQFKRVATVNLGGREFGSPPFSFDFSVSFVTAGSPATGELVLKNPSPDTFAAVERTGTAFPQFTLSAGYEKDQGLVMLGQIIKSEGQWQGGTRLLKLKLMDNANLWTSSRISLAFASPITASAILSAILAQAGVTGAQIQPAQNKTFERYAVNTSFREALLQLARETGSEVFSRQGQIYFRSPTTRDTLSAIELQSEDVIGNVEKTATGIKVRTLFNYRFAPGVFVELQTKSNPGLYKVQKCRLNWSDQGDAGVEFEAKAA